VTNFSSRRDRPEPFARRPLAARVGDEQGIALIVSLMAMMLMMALGVSLVMTTMTEGKIASNYRDGTEALYAADAAVERVMQDILTVPDWNTMIDPANKIAKSAFIDGDEEWRDLADGTRFNLRQATNLLNCGSIDDCAVAQMTAVTPDRPWGLNNPQWKLYAHGPLSDMLPTESINSDMYVVVWVADDPSESDNLPLKDGEPTPDCTPPVNDPNACINPGRGVIAMVAHAYGPNGVQRAIEVTLARTDTTEIERGYTGQRGQDEQNRRARKAAVQTPGKALTRSAFSTGA
jgi:Tfp pilus assembly protein PilX